MITELSLKEKQLLKKMKENYSLNDTSGKVFELFFLFIVATISMGIFVLVRPTLLNFYIAAIVVFIFFMIGGFLPLVQRIRRKVLKGELIQLISNRTNLEIIYPDYNIDEKFEYDYQLYDKNNNQYYKIKIGFNEEWFEFQVIVLS